MHGAQFLRRLPCYAGPSYLLPIWHCCGNEGLWFPALVKVKGARLIG